MTKHRIPRAIKAFTLVEVLVAEAVVLILLAVVVQLIFGVIQTAASEKKRMDALGDARQSLDRLSLDWSTRVRRTDVVGVFSHQALSSTNAANGQVSFLTQAQAYSGARHLSWVSYGISNVSQVVRGGQTLSTPALARGIFGYNFTSSDTTGTANPLMAFPVSAPDMTQASASIEPLADTIFRFDYCFLQQTPAAASATTSSAFTVNSSLTFSSTNLIGVVVAVASLDQQSRQQLSQSQLVALGNALSVVPDGKDPQSVWISSINNGTFAASARSAGVPASVANAVRVFQRVLYVKE